MITKSLYPFHLKNFVFVNGKPSKFLFPGGYYAYPANTANGLPSFGGAGGRSHDRVVVDSNDTIVQTTHYYPFGAVSVTPNFQIKKRNG